MKKNSWIKLSIVLVIGIMFASYWYYLKPVDSMQHDKLQTVTSTHQEAIENHKRTTSGEFGPYKYTKESPTSVAVSDTMRAIAYYEDGKGYVMINDKKFGPYNDITADTLKVSNNFWGIITNTIDPNALGSRKKTLYINGNAINFDNYADSIEFSFFDEKNSWVVKYFDQGGTGWKYMINGKSSTEKEYYGLSGVSRPFQSGESSNYYVTVDGQDVLIGDIYDEGAYFANCQLSGKNKWGCSLGKKDGRWHVVLYDNGVKKEYGPYGKFSDPRDNSEFMLSDDGFIFCSSDTAVIHTTNSEKVFHGKEIYQCRYAGGKFGFLHTNGNKQTHALININGHDYGPYDGIEKFFIGANNWGFTGFRSKTNKSEYIVNGKTLSDLDIIAGPAISDNFWSVLYEKDHQLYMKVGANTGK